MTRRPPWVRAAADAWTTVRMPWDWDAPSDARHVLVTDLEGRGVPQELVEDAEVVLAELVANAVEHGQADERGEFEFSWLIEADRLLLSVHDSGSATSDDFHVHAFDPDSLRGRGLAIIDTVSDAWRVQTDDGVRVSAELRFAPAGLVDSGGERETSGVGG